MAQGPGERTKAMGSANESGTVVLGLLGSPRARSNTRFLLEQVLVGAAEAGATTELIALRELTFRSCLHCGGCETTGRCVVQDDWQRVYQRIRAAKHIVLASPIQFSGVSGDMKAMIDRGQCFWVENYRLKQPVSEVPGERRGLFVASCGGRDTRVFDWAKPTVKAFFASIGVRYWKELFEPNTDEPPLMSERADALAKARELGRRIVVGGNN